MRIQGFEFEDLSWFPDSIRSGGTDYLRYFLNAVGFYKPVIPLISKSLAESGETELLDLCSGGGGAIEQIYQGLKDGSKNTIKITLSDKFPNVEAYRLLQQKTSGGTVYQEDSVDATAVPKEIKGFRTMFSAIHHFQPDGVKAVIKNAVDNRAGIALFDGGDKNLFTILGIIFFHPVAFLLCTPFFRPFRFSRIIFTYLIPLIPLMTVWDGCMSILRLYRPDELLKIANEVTTKQFVWKAGKVRNKLGMRVTYLIGYPLPDKN